MPGAAFGLDFKEGGRRRDGTPAAARSCIKAMVRAERQGAPRPEKAHAALAVGAKRP